MVLTLLALGSAFGSNPASGQRVVRSGEESLPVTSRPHAVRDLPLAWSGSKRLGSLLSDTDEASRSWMMGVDFGSDGASRLVRIHPPTGTVVELATLAARDLFDLTVTPDGWVYGSRLAPGFGNETDLVKIHADTGAIKVVSEDLGVVVNALASREVAVLYGATSNGQLVRFDLANGEFEIIGPFGSGLKSCGDMDFDRNGRLYGLAHTGFSCIGSNVFLVEIDLETGDARRIGTIGFDDVYGLAFAPSGRLYAVANAVQLSQPALLTVSKTTGSGTFLRDLDTFDGLGGLAPNLRFSPVRGRADWSGEENPDCETDAGEWAFCQHRQEPGHCDGSQAGCSTVEQADDTLAWDLNLPEDRDKGTSVYPLAAGEVVRYGGLVAPGKGCCGAVLIEHSEVDSASWWSGYQHLRSVDPSLKAGNQVDRSAFMGQISNKGSDDGGAELQLVVYEGDNVVGGLRSVDVVFVQSDRVLDDDFESGDTSAWSREVN